MSKRNPGKQERWYWISVSQRFSFQCFEMCLLVRPVAACTPWFFGCWFAVEDAPEELTEEELRLYQIPTA